MQQSRHLTQLVNSLVNSLVWCAHWCACVADCNPACRAVGTVSGRCISRGPVLRLGRRLYLLLARAELYTVLVPIGSRSDSSRSVWEDKVYIPPV
jgi:hypothetical protein